MTQLDEILRPPSGTFRTIFLYVGQGEATLMIVPEGEKNHKYILIDSNCGDGDGLVDVAKLLKGRMPENELIFINTHHHNDHISGIEEINKAVKIKEIWHTDFKPSSEHDDAYQELKAIVEKIGEENVFYLRGTNEVNILSSDGTEASKVEHKIGDVDYQVFSPSTYIFDEIDDEKPKDRDKRIHEQCGVIKFSYGEKSILLTGDSDKKAWQDHITDYYKDSIKSDVLSASHHGSRSFFKEGEEDEDIYEEHIEAIAPEYLVISAPRQSESQHDHPHDDALEIYEKHISKENIFHLGENRECVVADIDSSGNLKVDTLKMNRQEKPKNDDKSKEVIYETKPPKSKIYCSSCK